MIKKVLLILSFFLFLTSCDSSLFVNKVDITVSDAGILTSIKVNKGISIENALSEAGINLNALDKVEPSTSAIIDLPLTITITRVTEEYSVEESILPFEQQTVKNESLPLGQKVLIQSGINGKTQVIYRVVYENGAKVSNTFVSSETMVPSQPEIVMIGVQSPYSVQSINGMIAYISSGNAWVMEANTGNRRAISTSGNLDGRIFSLSPTNDGFYFRHPILLTQTTKLIVYGLFLSLQKTPNPLTPELQMLLIMQSGYLDQQEL